MLPEEVFVRIFINAKEEKIFCLFGRDCVFENNLSNFFKKLFYSCRCLRRALVTFFVTAKDESENTLLHFAALSKNVKWTHILLAKNAPHTGNCFGYTPLHFAASRKFVEGVKILLNEGGVDPNVKNDRHKTPLHEAASSYRTDLSLATQCSKLLLEKGANPNMQCDWGFVALHLAASSGDPKTTQLLLDRGADADQKNMHGITPAQYAEQHKQHECASLLKKRKKRSNETQPPFPKKRRMDKEKNELAMGIERSLISHEFAVEDDVHLAHGIQDSLDAMTAGP